MADRSSRRPLLMIGAVVAAALAAALAVLLQDRGDSEDQPDASQITTAAVQRRALAEYLEVDGTLEYADSLTLLVQDSGVLTHLAPEGAVLARGDRLYSVLDAPTDAETASVLAELASARSSLIGARDDLQDALSGPSESEVAAARAEVSAARADLDLLVAGPSRADIARVEASVAVAREALEALTDPSAGDLLAAEARLSAAQEALDELFAAASTNGGDGSADRAPRGSQAQIAAARAELARAELAREELIAGASEAEIEAARVAVMIAEEAVDDALDPYDSEIELAKAQSDLALARQALDDLVAGASQPERDAADAAILSAQDALADLLSTATQADVDEARAAVIAAREALDDLEAPSDADVMSARAQLAEAEEDLEDLLAGASDAETDTAEAALLRAEQALADLLAEPTEDDLAELKDSLSSAESRLVSAELQADALGVERRSRVVMYGAVPVYRTMAVGLRGDDVIQLEQNLQELGYGAGPDFIVDGFFDEPTAAAARAFQRDAGLQADGAVGPEDVIFVPGPVQVGPWAQGVEIGKDLVAGTVLTTLTVTQALVDGEMSATQRVVASLPLGDRDLAAEGDEVRVEFPDGAEILGVITAIGLVPVIDAQTGDSFVDVTVLLQAPAPSAWIGAPLDVAIVKTLVEDALVVPATALVALVEGGYAVEAVEEAGSVRLIGVETGLFADGDVEVLSTELSAGLRVVVPR